MARKLTDVLDGRVTAIHLQTAKDDATVVQRWTTDALKLPRPGNRPACNRE
jgi:hypothetical protein